MLAAYLRSSERRKPRDRKATGGRGREKREEKESKMEADVCRARSRGDCLDVPWRQSCRQCRGPSYHVTALHIPTPGYSVYIYCLRTSTNRVPPPPPSLRSLFLFSAQLGTYFKEIRETRKSEREDTESSGCLRIGIAQPFDLTWAAR